MASRTVFRFLILLTALVWILAEDTRRKREPWTNGSWFNMGILEFEKWSNQPNLFSEKSRLCARLRGLTPGQRRICRRHKDHMPAISAGVKHGIEECQFQFRGRRWNCTTAGDETVFGPLTLIVSNEEYEEIKVWLKYNKEPLTEVIDNWKKTSKLRLKELQSDKYSNINDVVNDWPSYKLSIGYKLIELDFESKFKGSEFLLFKKWPEFLDKALNHLKTIKAASVYIKLIEENPSEASRETAFTHAITSAGASLYIARACRDGSLSSCGCSRSHRPKNLHSDWVWAGCGVDLEYGYRFTEGFVDVRERERKVKRGSREQGRQLMNRHNNEAGRRAVIKKSRVTCKCHGVSGSCSLITCWQQLASFREIGDYLRDKYEGATEVKVSRRGKLRLSDPHYSLPTALDLVYLEDSPNYCVKNDTLGSLGTSGRECNRTSAGMDGCSLMCCGRGYNTKRMVVKERCDCKFHWCCRVECNTCVRTVEVYTCK